MFLNTKGRDVTGAEPELIAFLRFVENSTAEEAHLSEDPRIQEMYRKINTLKNSEAVEADYMTAEEYKRRLQEEAEEKGIDFRCKFMYPTDTGINAFDVSVILNNAITNAFEGVSGCKNPYVSISAYRKKNAYMLELTNCIRKRVEIDDETGLPESTKKDKGSHGFGLANIRKVAQKYYGDIDISQDENSFTLTVMLMVE